MLSCIFSKVENAVDEIVSNPLFPFFVFNFPLYGSTTFRPVTFRPVPGEDFHLTCFEGEFQFEMVLHKLYHLIL
jgi:hypothetical protein